MGIFARIFPEIAEKVAVNFQNHNFLGVLEKQNFKNRERFKITRHYLVIRYCNVAGSEHFQKKVHMILKCYFSRNVTWYYLSCMLVVNGVFAGCQNAFVTIYLINSFTKLIDMAVQVADIAGTTHRSVSSSDAGSTLGLLLCIL